MTSHSDYEPELCPACGAEVETCDCLMHQGQLRPVHTVPTGGLT